MQWYLHVVPGRVRLKNPQFRDEKVYERVRKILVKLTGTLNIKYNHRTGSIVVRYDPKRIDAHAIVKAVEQKGYFNRALAHSLDDYMHRAAAKIWGFVTNVI